MSPAMRANQLPRPLAPTSPGRELVGSTHAAQAVRPSRLWLGESAPVRMICAAMNFITALTSVRVVQRLLVPGISVEDTTTWSGAWSLVMEGRGRSVYQPAAQMLAQQRWISVSSPDGIAAWAFPPPHTFLMSPLGLLTPFRTYVLLSIASALVWLCSVRSMARWTLGRPVPWSRDASALFVASALSFSPVIGTIRYGSFSILVVGALWQVIKRIDKPFITRSQFLRVTLWLAAAALKPQMILFLMLGFVRRRFRVALGAGVLLSVLTIGICTFTGWGLIGDWVAVNKAIGTRNSGAALDRMWTLRGVLTRSLGSGMFVNAIWGVGLVATVLMLGWLWHRATNSNRMFGAVAASLALQCVGFPYQSSYDAVLLVPAVLLAYDVARRRSPTLARALGGFSVAASAVVLSGAWEEQLPGLDWRVPLPAMGVWLIAAFVVAIAMRGASSKRSVALTTG
jgi:hypothetical protein